MNKQNQIFSLNLSGFSLDFELWVDLSKEWTQRFSLHGNDFVFAVVDTWLRVDDAKYLIIPENNPGNFIETLKELTKIIYQPADITGAEKIIQQGELHKWIRGYWERLINDSCKADDEEIYNLLASSNILVANEGCIAVYRYNGIPTIEVSAKLENGNVVDVFCEINPKLIESDVEFLIQTIKSVIKKYLP